jgi:hypothetical protein
MSVEDNSNVNEFRENESNPFDLRSLVEDS